MWAKIYTVETVQKCMCCQQIETVSAFTRDQEMNCITNNFAFMSGCLDLWVLQIAYYLKK